MGSWRVFNLIIGRWHWLVLSLAIGACADWAVFRLMPAVYEATAYFTFNSAAVGAAENQSFSEFINTRVGEWRTSTIVVKTLSSYRLRFPADKRSDEELLEIIDSSKLELQPRSRSLIIAVRADSPLLASSLANCYVEAIAESVEQRGRAQVEAISTGMATMIEAESRRVQSLADAAAKFRTANGIETTATKMELAAQSHAYVADELRYLESEAAAMESWGKFLERVLKDPAAYGTLPTKVPLASEIAVDFREYQEADQECRKLLASFTLKHPLVRACGRRLLAAKRRLEGSARRAYDTNRSTLADLQVRIKSLREREEKYRDDHGSLERRSVAAEAGLRRFQDELAIANRSLADLMIERDTRISECERHREFVDITRVAEVPEEPAFPVPWLVHLFAFSLAAAIGIGSMVILACFDDRIVSLAYLEQVLMLKVLAIFPQAEGKERRLVARTLSADRHSHFAEAVLSLRNLLETPQYRRERASFLVISTQPGEGKTVTAASLAIAFAMSGYRTLLVDFDLRRPQQATIWGLNLAENRSFSHALENSISSPPDFAKLVNATEVKGLEVIASLPPTGIHPASIFGFDAIRDFFVWAHGEYDRVIVDAPPYGAVGDVITLTGETNYALLMCRPGKTRSGLLRACVGQLADVGVNLLGVVVNDADSRSISSFAKPDRFSPSKDDLEEAEEVASFADET